MLDDKIHILSMLVAAAYLFGAARNESTDARSFLNGIKFDDT